MRRTLLLALVALLCLPATVAGAQPVVWRVAIVRFLATAASCNGSAVSGSLDVATADRMVADFVTQVAAWSDGAALVESTIIERPLLVSLAPMGSGCWPGPGETQPPAGFDSVIVLWDPDRDQPSDPYVTSNAGLAYTDYRPGGSTYATVVVPDGDEAWQLPKPHPGMALVHEWGNGALAWYRQWWPRRVPTWYEWADYGYVAGDQWYEDVLGGDVVRPGGDDARIGLTPRRWRAGTPTGAQ